MTSTFPIVIAGLAVVIAGCRSAHQPPPPAVAKAAKVAKVPATERHCAPLGTPALPVHRSMGAASGMVYIVDNLPVELEPTITNERVADVLHGSTMTMTTTTADVRDVRPLPCTFTVVFPDRTCRVEATGKRKVSRSTTGPVGIPWGNSHWSLMVEVVDVAGCLAAGPSSDNTVVVEGIWNDLRVVDFETSSLGYSGGAGSRGATRDHEGNDLMPEIKRLPSVEQARYLNGPGFEVSFTKTRDLSWYASTEKEDRWLHRLRDGAGTLLIDHQMSEGQSVPIAQPGPVVRHGDRLYYFGALGVVRLR